MPVMPAYTPGLGEALSDAFDTYRGVKRQKMFDALTAQQGADAHIAAGDTHVTSAIDNILRGYRPLDVATTPAVVPPLSVGSVSASPLPSGSPNGAPGDDFEANLARSFAAPTSDLSNATAEGGRAPQAMVSPQHAYGHALMQSMAARGDKQSAAPPSMPSGNGGAADFQQNLANSFAGIPQLPGSRMALPGGLGSIDPSAGINRTLLMEGLNRRIQTQGAVDVASQTGQIAKNAAETAKATHENAQLLPSDLGYAEQQGRLEYTKAMATLPVETQKMVNQGKISLANALQGIAARGQVEGALQSNQQGFTAGENTRRFGFEQGQQGRALAGALSNSIAEERNKEGGQIKASVVRGIKSKLGLSTGTPDAAPNGAASVNLTQQRADWDAAAAHARSIGKDPDAVLPPRP